MSGYSFTKVLGFVVRLAALFVLSANSVTAGERRIALVIGNGSYEQLSPLANPTGDAEAVSQSLSALGFTVFLTTNLDQDRFRKAINFFRTRAEDADTALFYFAGHGATLAGRSYLFPTDFGKADIYDLREAVELENLLQGISSNLRTSLVFIDACRDNPVQLQSVSLGELFGTPQGPRSDPRVGTVISFATTPGQVAFDGNGPHSPFTGALLDHLETPGIDIELMLKRVRRDVVVNSQGQQVPWTESSLLSSFQLAPMGSRDLVKHTVSSPTDMPNKSLLSVLSDSGFAKKPVLQRISSGFSVQTELGLVGIDTLAIKRDRRSARIRALLCTVIDPPLPAHCSGNP